MSAIRKLIGMDRKSSLCGPEAINFREILIFDLDRLWPVRIRLSSVLVNILASVRHVHIVRVPITFRFVCRAHHLIAGSNAPGT